MKGQKQFCVKGHDTFVTGRYESGQCKICKQKVKGELKWPEE